MYISCIYSIGSLLQREFCACARSPCGMYSTWFLSRPESCACVPVPDLVRIYFLGVSPMQVLCNCTCARSCGMYTVSELTESCGWCHGAGVQCPNSWETVCFQIGH